ncbi:MAG: hypothetical protein WBF02_14670, partial [Xanthobacteraceae bacterium]
TVAALIERFLARLARQLKVPLNFAGQLLIALSDRLHCAGRTQPTAAMDKVAAHGHTFRQ